MKRCLLFSAAFVIVILACTKSKKINVECDQFYINKMNARWGEKSPCADAPYGLYNTLNRDTYKGETVYYEGVDGPGVISANIAALQYVVNCNGDSIKIDAGAKIEGGMLLARSCNQTDVLESLRR